MRSWLSVWRWSPGPLPGRASLGHGTCARFSRRSRSPAPCLLSRRGVGRCCRVMGWRRIAASFLFPGRLIAASTMRIRCTGWPSSGIHSDTTERGMPSNPIDGATVKRSNMAGGSCGSLGGTSTNTPMASSAQFARRFRWNRDIPRTHYTLCMHCNPGYGPDQAS